MVVVRLAVHIPVPLVDLALLEPEALVQLLNLLPRPDGILVELHGEHLVLDSVLPETLLGLFGSLGFVAYDNSRDCTFDGLGLLFLLQCLFCHSV